MTSLGANADGIFDFQDLSGNFSVGDIFLTLTTSLVLGLLIAYVYRGRTREFRTARVSSRPW